MRTKALLASSLLAPLALVAASAAPPAGPGGVVEAMRQFCSALDHGDRAALGALIETKGGGVALQAQNGKLDSVENATELAFYDVGRDGKPLAMHTRAEAIDRLLADVAGGEGHALHTEIVGMRADCPSGDCSFAIVDLVRSYGSGAERIEVPMRATALVRYQDQAPHFKLFHWHASRAPAQAGSGD